MGKNKRKFINKANAVTFHLVHRSQQDPLVTDETAPQRVLLEVDISATKDEGKLEKRKEEQKKYGITFDDDYDYLQHLKKPEQNIVWEYVENPNQAKKLFESDHPLLPKLQLPSSVFASEFEEEEGMLNKAAPCPGPHPDWDPDIVAALDDDFDFNDKDNQLDDDFIVKAMESEGLDNAYFDEYVASDESIISEENYEEMRDGVGSLQQFKKLSYEEIRSRFTDYSMSSSVNPRTEQLTLLDDRFEKFFASYDDPEVGDLSMEDIEGTWGQKHPYVLGCFKQFKRSQALEDYNKEWDKERIEKYRYISDNNDEEFIELEIEDPSKKKWDCESIVSTYSTIHNHPKLIEEPKSTCNKSKIKIDPKNRLPLNALRGEDSQLTAKTLNKFDGCLQSQVVPKSLCDKSVISTLSALSIRPKDELSHEKKERKHLLKDYRQMRRVERKANSIAFKEEKKRQIHNKINNQVNIQSNKIL